MSAAKLGIKATIVMPKATPLIKVEGVRAFGGDSVQIKLVGDSFDEAAAEVMEGSVPGYFYDWVGLGPPRPPLTQPSYPLAAEYYGRSGWG